MATIKSPVTGVVLEVVAESGQQCQAGDALLVLESMKVQIPIALPNVGVIKNVLVGRGDTVEQGSDLLTYLSAPSTLPEQQGDATGPDEDAPEGTQQSLQQEARQRREFSEDNARPQAAQRRHSKGFRTARENLADLMDDGSFDEYGQLAVAAQRQRRELQELQIDTAADGVITGVGTINAKRFGEQRTRTAVAIYDYSVLAGTQGFFHHQKLDRIIEVATNQGLPVIMYTEGGGGRPGDTDVVTMSTGLHCHSFTAWAGLAGVVPRIAVANGYNFAGNAALFGAADITIATQSSWIGMAGPAMIEGGGLGDFRPTEIGPIEVQSANGVVDIVVQDEAAATRAAQDVLAVFQGDLRDWHSKDQASLDRALPENRRYTYDVRAIINTVLDADSFIELRRGYGGAVVCGFGRLRGRSIGVLASDCTVLGGAIDVDAADKAADFMRLCNNFGLPLVSLSDTPGFMVGPEHETRGAVRRLSALFTAGAQLTVPLVGVVLRKCYGLGAQALLGGSTLVPDYTAAWPSGEFGGMGLEGAVKLGFKRELDAQDSAEQRQALFDKLLEQQYQRGKAVEVATLLEIDAVIQPRDTRGVIARALNY